MNSVWVSHPTGNVFVRALLQALNEQKWDYHFFSTLAFSAAEPWLQLFPPAARAELSRRSYELPPARMTSRPAREGLRLLVERLGNRSRTADLSALSVDAVYQDLDCSVANALERTRKRPAAIYAYEDGALATFESAAQAGVARVYDLPILFWKVTQQVLQDEAARLPQWEPTLGATRDPEAKLERKTRELALADTVICPSRSVLDSLPPEIRAWKKCVVAPFGSPDPVSRPAARPGKLRVLFAGQMTQRKGLADVFAAMNLVRSAQVELVVLGKPILPISFYRSIFAGFVHEPPRSHPAALELMASCDVLVLPSLVEGRALVQQEALACGLPLIVTENAGAADIIVPRKTGFLVPIRSPAEIAAKIDWFASHRQELEAMREECRGMAAAYRWSDYTRRILDAVSHSRTGPEAVVR